MTRRIICLLAAVLFSSTAPALAGSVQRGLSVTGNSAAAGPWGNYHALIVGINAYREWPALRTAVKDATVIRDTLVKRYGFDPGNVILRTNRSASRLQIIRDLRYMAQSMGPDDNLLVYYAGHGQLDDLTGDGYWVPAEGKLKDPGTWVANSYIKAVLSSEKVAAKNVVVIADSCYSGAMLRGGPSLMSLDDRRYRERLVEKAALRSRQVISSGGVEPVADGGAEGHSLFAFYLIDALRKNDREVIDLENLFHTRVWKPVTEIGQQRPNVGRLKTPMDQDGQFVLYNVAWARERQAAIDAQRDRTATRAAPAEQARQRAAVAAAELELQRQRIEMEKEKLAYEREQLARERILEKERRELEQQKRDIEYARLQARLEDMARRQKAEPAPDAVKAPPLAAVTRSRQPGDDRDRMALFPIKLLTDWGGVDLRYRSQVIQALEELSVENARLEFSYVYKKAAGRPEQAADFPKMAAAEAGQIWVKPSFFAAYEPDWTKLAAMGARLDTDLAVLVSLKMSATSSMDVYLYDYRRKKKYALRGKALNYNAITNDVRQYIGRLLEDYFENR